MSHVIALTPDREGPYEPGAVVLYTVGFEVPQDAGFSLSAEDSQGGVITVVAVVDRPAGELAIDEFAQPASHRVRLKADAGTLALVPGEPTKVAWTLPR